MMVDSATGASQKVLLKSASVTMKQWYSYLVSQLRHYKDEINQMIYVLF
jgi:hypothetical protein